MTDYRTNAKKRPGIFSRLVKRHRIKAGVWQYCAFSPAVLLAFIILVPAFARAATPHFTNGDRLQGQYIAMKDGERVIYQTRFGETIEVA